MENEVQYAMGVIGEALGCELMKIESPFSTMWTIQDPFDGVTDTYILSHFNGVNQLMNIWSGQDGEIRAERIDLVDLQEWAVTVQNRSTELTD